MKKLCPGSPLSINRPEFHFPVLQKEICDSMCLHGFSSHESWLQSNLDVLSILFLKYDPQLRESVIFFHTTFVEIVELILKCARVRSGSPVQQILKRWVSSFTSSGENKLYSKVNEIMQATYNTKHIYIKQFTKSYALNKFFVVSPSFYVSPPETN